MQVNAENRGKAFSIVNFRGQKPCSSEMKRIGMKKGRCISGRLEEDLFGGLKEAVLTRRDYL